MRYLLFLLIHKIRRVIRIITIIRINLENSQAKDDKKFKGIMHFMNIPSSRHAERFSIDSDPFISFPHNS